MLEQFIASLSNVKTSTYCWCIFWCVLTSILFEECETVNRTLQLIIGGCIVALAFRFLGVM